MSVESLLNTVQHVCYLVHSLCDFCVPTLRTAFLKVKGWRKVEEGKLQITKRGRGNHRTFVRGKSWLEVLWNCSANRLEEFHQLRLMYLQIADTSLLLPVWIVLRQAETEHRSHERLVVG